MIVYVRNTSVSSAVTLLTREYEVIKDNFLDQTGGNSHVWCLNEGCPGTFNYVLNEHQSTEALNFTIQLIFYFTTFYAYIKNNNHSS